MACYWIAWISASGTLVSSEPYIQLPNKVTGVRDRIRAPSELPGSDLHSGRGCSFAANRT